MVERVDSMGGRIVAEVYQSWLPLFPPSEPTIQTQTGQSQSAIFTERAASNAAGATASQCKDLEENVLTSDDVNSSLSHWLPLDDESVSYWV